MNEKIIIGSTVDRDALSQEVARFNAALAERLKAALALVVGTHPTYGGRYAWVQLDVDGLYLTFTSVLDERTAAEYDCSCCRTFVNRYLTSAILDTHTGKIVRTLMPEADQVDDIFKPGVIAAQEALLKANVIGVFPIDEIKAGHKLLGVKMAGGFDHFHFELDPSAVRTLIAGNTLDAYTRLSQREEQRDMLVRSLKAHDPVLVQASVIHINNAFGESVELRKFVHNLQAFVEVKTLFEATTGIDRSRLLNNYAMRGNQAVIRMDTGGALLGGFLSRMKDAGDNEQQIKNALNWLATNGNGIRYRRQVAAPKDGTIHRANQIFEERGLAPSMARRALPLAEVVSRVWERKEAVQEETKSGGFFDKQLSTKPDAPAKLPPRKRTVRLSQLGEVIQEFDRLYHQFSRPGHSAILIGLTTAVNLDAPPILKWDDQEDRYPYSGYQPSQPRPLSEYGQALADEVRETGRAEIAVVTNMLERMRLGNGQLLALYVNGHHRLTSGSSLFPETLRPDLYEVSKVIEQYSNNDPLVDREKGAVGWWLNNALIIGVRADGSEDHITVVAAE